MINTPGNSTAMNSDQSQQLAVFETRLNAMKLDITEVKKKLLSERKDLDRTVKEREYQQELRDVAQTELLKVNDELDQARKVLKDVKSTADEQSKRSKELMEQLDSRALEVATRERAVSAASEALVKEQEIQAVKSAQLSADQASVKEAKEAFLKAVESVPWR